MIDNTGYNADFLKKCLSILDITRIEMAKQCGIHRDTLSRLLNEKTAITKENKSKIIQNLHRLGISNAETFANPIAKDEPKLIIYSQFTTKEENIPMDKQTKDIYGLSDDPFKPEIPTPDKMWMNKEYESILDTVIYAATSHQFVGIVGPVGSGKSALLRKTKDIISKDESIVIVNIPEFAVRRMDDARLGSTIIRAITGEFRDSDYDKRAEQLDLAIEDIKKQEKALVIFIDEAHHLPPEGLVFVKVIFGSYDNLSIILFAQKGILKPLSHLTEVQERLELIRLNSFQHKDLNHQNVISYINHKLQLAGAKQLDIISNEAAQLIGEVCNTPLQVNQLCRMAMIKTAKISTTPLVTADIVQALIQ